MTKKGGRLQRYILISLSFFLASFTSFADRPKWLERPYQTCLESRELCAVGEAQGMMQAQIRAREALAASFETMIEGTLRVQQTSQSSQNAEQVVRGEVLEQVNSTVVQKTKLLLNSVVIREQYEDRDAVYALAVLNREQGGRFLRQEIETIDTQNKALFDEGRRSGLITVMRNQLVRDRLELFYNFLTKRRIPAPVSTEKIWAKRREFREQGTTLYIDAQNVEETHQHQMSLEVIRELLSYDYKVVTDPKQKHDYRITLAFYHRPRHLNVRGFVRNEYELVLQSFKGKQQVGQIKISDTQVARSLEQGLERAMPKLMSLLNKQVDKLRLD